MGSPAISAPDSSSIATITGLAAKTFIPSNAGGAANGQAAAAERGGDFSQALTTTPITIYDPLNGLPFPNNAIPTTRFNRASAGLLQYFPNPTYAGIVQDYRFVITDR